jgi:hypothetical protein
MGVIDSLETEMKRAKGIIADCEVQHTLSFVAAWLRALVLRGEQAIRDNDITECVVCLREIREVKRNQ